MKKKPNGYHLDKRGKYLVTTCYDGKSKHIGYFDTEEEAKEVYFKEREKRLKRCVKKYGHLLEDGKIYKDHYIVFDNGDIFNMYGYKLTPQEVRGGYLRQHINAKPEMIHRIVANCFIPNPLNKPCVNHIDGNKKNNHVSNLEWCTYSENMKHAVDTGLYTAVKGERNGQSKLTKADIEFIRVNYKPRSNDFNVYTLAKQFNVLPQHISRIVNYQRWKE